MRVLVTGAGGMLGREVAALAESRGDDVSALTREDLDITDAAAVTEVVKAFHPGVVVNCAAWTDVDGAEVNEAQAVAVNGDGAGNVAAAAASLGAHVIYPSTDYVFDGKKGEPYVEDDPTAPLSAYGRSKLAGEEATSAANPRHFIVRTSWVFGPGGANFVETMLRIAAERGEVSVVEDQIGCPSYTGHLATAIGWMVDRSPHGIHHLSGSGSCSWYEFAREIFTQAGVECEVTPVRTSEFPRPAVRPANGVLATTRAERNLPPWEEGLRDYLARRATTAKAAR